MMGNPVRLMLLSIVLSAVLVSSQETQANNSELMDPHVMVKRTTGDVHHGTGTSCVVKGSYCQCHYCKCEKGQLHCRAKGLAFHHGFGKFETFLEILKNLLYFPGKKYCYGSMEGEYCHCDYCRCKHGYGLSGHNKHAHCVY